MTKLLQIDVNVKNNNIIIVILKTIFIGPAKQHAQYGQYTR